MYVIQNGKKVVCILEKDKDCNMSRDNSVFPLTNLTSLSFKKSEMEKLLGIEEGREVSFEKRAIILKGKLFQNICMNTKQTLNLALVLRTGLD